MNVWPRPMTAAPSSWPRTWPGLSALPTSDTVTCRVTATSPVSRSTSTSTAVQLNSKNAAVPPSGWSGSASLRISPMPMTSPPSGASPRIRTSRMGSVPLADPDLAAVDDDVRLVDTLEPRRHRPQLRLDGAAAVQDRGAHEHRRPARRRLLVVRHDGGVAHDDGDPVERRAELLGRDLGEDRPRALAHVRRAGVDDDAAVGQQPDGRVGQAGRRARTSARPRCRGRARAASGSPSR